jgi:hypothetical protein
MATGTDLPPWPLLFQLIQSRAGDFFGSSYFLITLTLTYDPTLSRVRLVGGGLDQFTFVTFERSSDLISWTTVRGGESVPVSAGAATLDDYEFLPNEINYYRMTTLAPFSQTSDVEDITPAQTDVWLKSIARPFLNIIVSPLGGRFEYDRPERGAAFAVVGRSLPVAVTDLRGSRRYALKLRTDTAAQAAAIEALLASGDILFLQAPAGSVVPSGGVYLMAGAVKVQTPDVSRSLRFTNIDVTEVAAPGADVVGATSTWQTVIDTYATWADVIAAKATWTELLDLVGDAGEVVVE